MGHFSVEREVLSTKNRFQVTDHGLNRPQVRRQLHHGRMSTGPQLGSSKLLWPMGFGLACCAIEMMAASARGSTSRASAPKCSVPRLVSPICDRRRHRHERRWPSAAALYDQMPEPKWVISMAAAPMRRPVPHVQRAPGCRQDRARRRLCVGLPAASEALLYGLMRLQDKIRKESTSSAQSACHGWHVRTHPRWRRS